MNMLQKARSNTAKSGHKVLKDVHDFQFKPWAPPGCKVILHKPTFTQTLWGPWIIDALYLSLWIEYYWCYCFYALETRKHQDTGAVKFSPKHCKIPEEMESKAKCKDCTVIRHHQKTQMKNQRKRDNTCGYCDKLQHFSINVLISQQKQSVNFLICQLQWCKKHQHSTI